MFRRALSWLFGDDPEVRASIAKHESYLAVSCTLITADRARVELEVTSARVVAVAVPAAVVAGLVAGFELAHHLIRLGGFVGELGGLLGGLLFCLALTAFASSIRGGRRLRLRILHASSQRVAAHRPQSIGATTPVAASAFIAPSRVEEARRLIEGGRALEGIALLNELPRDSRALQYRAVALGRLGKQDEAAEIAREVVARAETTPASLAEASMTLTQAGAPEEGLRAAEAALAAGAGDRAVVAVSAAARALDTDDAWARAAAAFSAALAVSSTSEQLRLAHYKALREVALYDEVGAALDVLCRECKSPDPPFWRAHRHTCERDFASARADFVEARRRGGRAAEVDLGEAEIHRLEGDLVRAAALIAPDEVMEVNKGFAFARLARVRELQGREGDARAAYAESLRRDPRQAHRELRSIERDRTDPGRATSMEDLASLLALAPMDERERAALQARLNAACAASAE